MLDCHLEMPDDPRFVYVECPHCLFEMGFFEHQLEISCTNCNETFMIPEPDIIEPFEEAYGY